MIIEKTKSEIELLRETGRIVAFIIRELSGYVKPGITTKELDRIALSIMSGYKVKPAFLGYRGYPSNICVSVNSQIVHGIPSERKLLNGDIVSIDLGIIKDGFYGDIARTFGVGKISDLAKKLLDITEKALYKGIEKATIGSRVGDISYAVQNFVESNGFSVVRDFVGHGIGRSLQEEPQIPNYGIPNTGTRLTEGMVLAIEPMINAGGCEVKILSDGWTAETLDGSLSAHFEDMVAITKNGHEILTEIERKD